MKHLHPLLAALLLALPMACNSAPSPTAPSDAAAADIACRCGTPLGDLEGCAHPTCLAGENNPDNPDCVCGTLDIPASKEKE